MKRPTVDEITSYCLHRENRINPEQFFDYYQSCGWVVGKSRKPMKDWQAAVRTWERDKPKPMQAFINKHTNMDWVN